VVDAAGVTEAEISKMMVGRDVFLKIEKKKAKPGRAVLSVRNLSCRNKYGLYAIQGLSFDVRSGEILGVAGVEGNGQSELSDVLSGLMPIQEGDVLINGQSIKGKSIRHIREAGVSIVHEDRMTYGASSGQSIAENLIAARYYQPEYMRFGILRLKYIAHHAKELIKNFAVKCEGPSADVKTLSGGNIQKVVAAREFSSSPKLLIACHPTRGIDVGATELIRKRMVALRDEENTATLFFSADLSELLAGSDSIIVMHEGSIVAYFPDASAVDEEMLGEYMLGIKKQSSREIGGVVHERAK
jgi:simple sugar transport system ATP-binding protein